MRAAWGRWAGPEPRKPDDIAAAIRSIRQLTDRAFNINLFAWGYAAGHDIDPRPMVDIVVAAHAKLGLPWRRCYRQCRAIRSRSSWTSFWKERPPVSVFTFGIPTAAQIAALKRRDIAIVGTATTVEEARLLEQAGVDAIVAQGAEAGAHRGSFAAPFEASMVPLATLVREICANVRLPVIASGGIMNGRDTAAAMELGAAAVQLGTAFLPCPEFGSTAGLQARACSMPSRIPPSSPARSPDGRHAA